MGKSIADIVKELAEGEVIEGMIKGMKVSVGEDSENLKDLAQDIYLDLLTKKTGYIEGLYERGELNFYLSKMISNNIYSKNSRYYTRYKKFLTEEINEETGNLVYGTQGS